MEESASNPGPNYVGFAEQSFETDIKAIAFYLPQYHPIPENDEWWGRGFTEWTNVSKAAPIFAGHTQPHLPGELGFYDLRVRKVLERQVELARAYGIHGFAFYFYWFNGRRILESPLDQFTEVPELDFPFCLMWANENWTRRWDGLESHVLLAQRHTVDSDSRVIEEFARYIKQPNYIRLDGRPLVMMYRPQLMEDPKAVTSYWRAYCREHGLGDPLLVTAKAFGAEDPREFGFDGSVEFPPLSLPTSRACAVTGLYGEFRGDVRSYPAVAKTQMQATRNEPFPVYEGATPGWDNTARRGKNGISFAFSSPVLYRNWIAAGADRVRNNPLNPERLLFVNAWNEWAEGAHLEPDRRYGYAYLQATAEGLAKGHAGAPDRVLGGDHLDPGGVYAGTLGITPGLVLVREPVGRLVTLFLESAEMYVEHLQDRMDAGDLCGEELRELFLHWFEGESMEEWFTRHEYDPFLGYYESLTRSVHVEGVVFGRVDQPVHDLLELVGKTMEREPEFPANMMARERLFREAPLPRDWVRDQLESRFAQHFFLPAERDQILAYWCGPR
jgi:hypothetical protein